MTEMMEENRAVGIVTHQVNQLYGGFVLSFGAATLVNKYVLSVLKFTYPTIFQGWQMLAGCIVLQCLALTGKISITPAIFNTERIAVVKWLPAVVLYVISAYTGSVALAHLPVPVFLACQNLIPVIMEFDDNLRHRCLQPSFQTLISFFIIISVVMVVISAPELNYMGYSAVFIHVITSAAYTLFDKLTTYKINLRSFERLYCSYVFSCVVFAPVSYLLGDFYAVKDFEFYHLYEFYGGCLASGVLGAFLSLTIVKLAEYPTFFHVTNQLMSLSRMLIAVLSLFLFEVPFNTKHAFWMMFTLLVSLLGTTNLHETQEDIDGQHEI